MEADSTLPFLAVGRVKDNTGLATYSTLDVDRQREETQEVFKKLLLAAKSKLQAGSRQRLQWGEGGVYCLVDRQGSLLYVLMTSMVSYPEGLAYQLLYDLTALVQQRSDADSVAEGGLSDAIQPRMRELVELYQDPVKYEQTVGKKARMISEDAGTSNTPMISSERVESQQSGSDAKSKIIMAVAGIVVILLILIIWMLSSGTPATTTPAGSAATDASAADSTDSLSALALYSAAEQSGLLQAPSQTQILPTFTHVVI